MSMTSFVGSFDTGTGAVASTVVVTGVGFVPKAVIFWYSGNVGSGDSSGAVGGSHERGFGWATGPTSRGTCYGSSQDAATTSNANRGQTQSACIGTTQPAGSASIDGLLDFVSFDADGFTLEVDNLFSASFRVHFLALGGDDLTNVATGSFQEQAATGNYGVTGVGFQPDCVLFLSIQFQTMPVDTAHGSLSLGAAVSAAQQAVWLGSESDAVATTETGHYCKSGEIWANISAASLAASARAAFVSMDADGFTVNFTERSSTRYILYLALKGGRYAVGNLLTQTDTTTPIAETGVGVGTPKAVLFASACAVEDTIDAATAHDQLSFGVAASATQRRAIASWSEDATADGEVALAQRHEQVYINIAADDTVQGLMDVQSFDADGFTCIMDDADPAQKFVWYLAIGDAASAAGQAPRTMFHKRLRGI